MYFIARNKPFNSLHYYLRYYRLARKCHYEVLNLSRKCTDKEIKDAFIQMSKEYHPDKNKDAKAQEKFVHIVEAYNVLSKPGSRARYDSMTEVGTSSTSYDYRSHVNWNTRNNSQYSYYYDTRSKARNNDDSTKSYYGVAGIQKMPNYYIIFICVGVALFGIFLQGVVIRNMYFAQRERAQEKSKILAEELDKVRAAAVGNSNELQTKLLLGKIVAASNPTVATASLGHALASEKK